MSAVREIVLAYRGQRRGIADRITSSRNVDTFARKVLKAHLQLVESFWVIPLDAKNAPVGYHEVSRGSLSACPVAPADVLRPLILANASGFIAVHNHPSGVADPSPDDVALTERLQSAAALIGIRLVDHVVVGDPEYFSFLDAGLISQGDR